MMRHAPRVALVFTALVFGSLALQGLFAPQYLADSLGLHATTAGGENEFRAVYAGLAGGIALFFALASVRPAWHLPGLAAQLCIFGGLIAARVMSIAVSGRPGASIYIMLAGEVLGALIALVALRRHELKPAATAAR